MCPAGSFPAGSSAAHGSSSRSPPPTRRGPVLACYRGEGAVHTLCSRDGRSAFSRRVAVAMAMDQVNALCEQLVKAVTVMMDPSSTQRYRLEALKVAGVWRAGPALDPPSAQPSRRRPQPGSLLPTRALDFPPQAQARGLLSPLSALLPTASLLCRARLPFSRDVPVPNCFWRSHLTTTSHCPLLPLSPLLFTLVRTTTPPSTASCVNFTPQSPASPHPLAFPWRTCPSRTRHQLHSSRSPLRYAFPC